MNQSISPSSQFPSRKGNISTGYSNPPHNRALFRPHSLSRRHISLLDPLSLHRMTGYQTKGLTTTTNSPVRVAHASVWSPHQHDQSSFEYDSHDSLSHAYRRTLPFGRTGRHSHITLHALVLGLVLQARNDQTLAEEHSQRSLSCPSLVNWTITLTSRSTPWASLAVVYRHHSLLLLLRWYK